MTEGLVTKGMGTEDQVTDARPFAIPVRINYEDTDAGGVVYYANYLAYMERCRNECLRELGYPLAELQSVHNLIFVVTRVDVRYKMPARLDDLLSVNLRIANMRAASLFFRQQVMRSEDLLVEATVKLATLRADTFSPCRMPDQLRQSIQQYQINYVS